MAKKTLAKKKQPQSELRYVKASGGEFEPVMLWSESPRSAKDVVVYRSGKGLVEYPATMVMTFQEVAEVMKHGR